MFGNNVEYQVKQCALILWITAMNSTPFYSADEWRIKSWVYNNYSRTETVISRLLKEVYLKKHVDEESFYKKIIPLWS